jgi:hypothetical protein
MSEIGKIISKISTLQKKGTLGTDIYYRGQRKGQVLLPSFLRNKDRYKESLSVTENMFYCDTWVMAANELKGVSSSWEALALFQHYQIPTRLLDWTSSLISAIFFAISKCLGCKRDLKCGKDKECEEPDPPVIWILDPQKMHGKLHKNTKLYAMSAVTIGVDDAIIQDYKKVFVEAERGEKIWKFRNGPIFMEIPWNNPRIRMQKGYFTFHASDKPLQSLIGERNGLAQIEIQIYSIRKMVQELNTIGITEYDVYPDIASLGQYFRRKYSY